jgi:hypothetical protein
MSYVTHGLASLDSKLTQLLQEALGGNAKTVVIVAAALEPQHAVETIQTLRFGEQCAAVTSGALQAQAQSAVLVKALAAIDDQLAECEATIKRGKWDRQPSAPARSSVRRARYRSLTGLAACLACSHLTDERWEERRRVVKSTVSAFDNVVHDADGTIDLSNEAAKATTQEVEHVVVGQVLVGAEEARKRLEGLLQQRKLLLGEV